MFGHSTADICFFDKNEEMRNFLNNDDDKTAQQYRKYLQSPSVQKLSKKEMDMLYSGVYCLFCGPEDELLELFQFSNRLHMCDLFGVIQYIVNKMLNILIYVGFSSSDYRIQIEANGDYFNRKDNRLKSSSDRARVVHPLGIRKTCVIRVYVVTCVNEPQARFIEANVVNLIRAIFYHYTINGIIEINELKHILGSEKFYHKFSQCFAERIIGGLVEYIGIDGGNKTRLVDGNVMRKLQPSLKIFKPFPNSPKWSTNVADCSKQIDFLINSPLLSN